MQGISGDSDEENNRSGSNKKKKRVVRRAPLGDDFATDLVVPSSDEDNDDGDSTDLFGADSKPLEYRDGVLVSKTIFVRPAKKKLSGAADLSDEEEDDGSLEDDVEENSADEDEDDSEGDDQGDSEGDDQDDSEGDDEENEEASDDQDDEDDDVDDLADEASDENAVAELNDNVSAEEDSDLEASSRVANVTKAVDNDQEEIPFTFPAPKTYSDFSKLVEGYSAPQQSTVIHRLRVLYHVKLGGDNRSKLETLLSILFEHFDRLAKEGDGCVAVMDALMRPLHEMSIQFPGVAAATCLQRLKRMHARVYKNPGNSDGKYIRISI